MHSSTYSCFQSAWLQSTPPLPCLAADHLPSTLAPPFLVERSLVCTSAYVLSLAPVTSLCECYGFGSLWKLLRLSLWWKPSCFVFFWKAAPLHNLPCGVATFWVKWAQRCLYNTEPQSVYRSAENLVPTATFHRIPVDMSRVRRVVLYVPVETLICILCVCVLLWYYISNINLII